MNESTIDRNSIGPDGTLCRLSSPALAPVGFVLPAVTSTAREERSKMSAGSLIFVLVLVGGALAMFSMRRRGGHSHGVGGGCDGGGDGDGHGSSDRDGSAEEAREEESR